MVLAVNPVAVNSFRGRAVALSFTISPAMSSSRIGPVCSLASPAAALQQAQCPTEPHMLY